MRRLSTVAAIACVGMIGIGLTGCGGGGGGAPATVQTATAENPCPIPQEVKASTTLDLNRTVGALMTAMDSGEMAFWLADDGFYWGYNTAKKSAASSDSKKAGLTAVVLTKANALQKQTGVYVRALTNGDASIEYGDNIPCDSGSYSAHDANSESGGEEDGVDISSSRRTFTLTFNQCVLEDNLANEDLIAFFREWTLYTSRLYSVSGSEPEPAVYTFNGSMALEYSDNNSYESLRVAPRDVTGGGDKEIYEGSASLRTNNLHWDRQVGDAVEESFDSNEVLSIAFKSSYESNETETYDSVDAYSDGNYTEESIDKETFHLAVELNGNEEEKWFEDVNSSYSFTALCYAADVAWTHEIHSISEIRNGSAVNRDKNETFDSKVNSSGYLAMQDIEDGEVTGGGDVYADGLTIEVHTASNDDSWKMDGDGNQVYDPVIKTSEFTVNGTVGSTLLGGSVAINTVAPWKMSSEYPGVDDYSPDYYRGFRFKFLYSPYAGETTFTGTNVATVKFYLEDNNDTDVNVTIDGQTTHKESIYDLFDSVDWHY